MHWPMELLAEDGPTIGQSRVVTHLRVHDDAEGNALPSNFPYGSIDVRKVGNVVVDSSCGTRPMLLLLSMDSEEDQIVLRMPFEQTHAVTSID